MDIKSVDAEKNSLRTEFLKIRREIPENQKKEQSRRIAARLFETVEYQNAESVFVFISVKDETDTSEIIKRCFKDKKRVAVPLCNTKEHTMTAIEISDSGQVERGAGFLSQNTV